MNLQQIEYPVREEGKNKEDMIHISCEGREREGGWERGRGEGEREKEAGRDLPIFSSRLMGRRRSLHGAALTCNTLHRVSNSAYTIDSKGCNVWNYSAVSGNILKFYDQKLCKKKKKRKTLSWMLDI